MALIHSKKEKMMDNIMNLPRRIGKGTVLLTVSFSVLVASICYGASCETYAVDPVHSSLVFRIKHLGIAFFYGRFNDPEGTVTIDPENPENNSVSISVQTGHINTFNPERDSHLKSPDFFDAEKFPVLSFNGNGFKLLGKNTYEVRGNLTFHGVSRPIIVIVEHTGSGNDPWGGYRTGFETTFKIRRSDFGMKYMMDGIDDTVRVTLSVEAVRQLP